MGTFTTRSIIAMTEGFATALPHADRLIEHLAEMFESEQLPEIFIAELELRGFEITPRKEPPPVRIGGSHCMPIYALDLPA